MKALEELTAEIREKLPRLTRTQTFHWMTFSEEITVQDNPMLNDVLQWFKESDMRDGVNMMPGLTWRQFVHDVVKLWDLSKPYLKDQSPELITFLHSLIKK